MPTDLIGRFLQIAKTEFDHVSWIVKTMCLLVTSKRKLHSISNYHLVDVVLVETRIILIGRGLDEWTNDWKICDEWL